MKLTIFLFLMLSIVACSSSIRVHEITNTPNSEDVPGIPFRVLRVVPINLYQKQADGTYKHISQKEMELPDLSRLYTINFESGYFSNADFELKLNENNTISWGKLHTDSKLDESVAQMSSTSKAVADAILSIEETRKKAEAQKDQSDMQKITQSRSAVEQALQSMIKVKEAERDYANATQENMAVREAELKLAKIKANHAYQNAGLAIPFPDVLP